MFAIIREHRIGGRPKAIKRLDEDAMWLWKLMTYLFPRLNLQILLRCHYFVPCHT
jgi:hypothetical protein